MLTSWQPFIIDIPGHYLNGIHVASLKWTVELSVEHVYHMCCLLISIKIDSATRLGRSIIGINAQYIENKIIMLRTLDMYEVNDRQTGLYIKNVIYEVLSSFDIKLSQIYSITSDNGRNMLKAAEFLMDEYEIPNSDDELIDEVEPGKPSYEEEKYILDNLHPNIVHMKCVAHTVQLAVQDTLSSFAEDYDYIDRCRTICKKLRTPNIANIAKKLNLKKVILDCPTRWNSTYNMLQRLLDYKTFCSDLVDLKLTMDDAISGFFSCSGS